MMTLAVVTLTTGDRPALLERCINSVKSQLPESSAHFIIEVDGLEKYIKARIDSLKLGKYYAIVDDDDIVVNNSLNLCLDAIQKYNTGVAFTDEALVNIRGDIISKRTGTRTYEEIFNNPHRVHHLSVVESTAVDEDSAMTVNKSYIIDGWMRFSAIKNKGAVHVPIIGYHWTQHTDSMSKTIKKEPVPKIINNNINNTGIIPQYLC